jgi:hypothetical protein
MGFLIVSSRPPGAELTLDGQGTGKKTPYAESVAAGDHSITLALDGYRSLTVAVRVEKGGKTSPDLELEAVWGDITFDVRPTAKIYLDGGYILDTPYVKPYRAQAGKHTLSIVNEALGVDKRIQIEVKEGETVSVQEVLK